MKQDVCVCVLPTGLLQDTQMKNNYAKNQIAPWFYRMEMGNSSAIFSNSFTLSCDRKTTLMTCICINYVCHILMLLVEVELIGITVITIREDWGKYLHPQFK